MLYSALTLRCRQPGDTFRPAGRGIRKELRMSSDMPARLFTMPPSNGRQHAVT